MGRAHNILLMKIDVPVFQGLTLAIADEPNGRTLYPTTRLQKGLVLVYHGQDLAEEAVGFGLPVLKRGLQTYFPGKIKLDLLQHDTTWMVTAVYTLNLVEKIARSDSASIKSTALYSAKNYLAALIRAFPPVRASLTTFSSVLRRAFGWKTTYETAGFSSEVKLVYTFDQVSGSLLVEIDLASPPQDAATEIIVMNEQGAHYFDQYSDSSGACLSGKEIGCWEEITADYATFASSTHPVAFSLPRVSGARLFRGRELIGSRLAWAGFGVSFPPIAAGLSYMVKLEKLP